MFLLLSTHITQSTAFYVSFCSKGISAILKNNLFLDVLRTKQVNNKSRKIVNLRPVFEDIKKRWGNLVAFVAGLGNLFTWSLNSLFTG